MVGWHDVELFAILPSSRPELYIVTLNGVVGTSVRDICAFLLYLYKTNSPISCFPASVVLLLSGMSLFPKLQYLSLFCP